MTETHEERLQRYRDSSSVRCQTQTSGPQSNIDQQKMERKKTMKMMPMDVSRDGLMEF